MIVIRLPPFTLDRVGNATWERVQFDCGCCLFVTRDGKGDHTVTGKVIEPKLCTAHALIDKSPSTV